LPVGNLRECRYRANRADIVVVSKSPVDLDSKEQALVVNQIQKYADKSVFFSQISYDTRIFSKYNSLVVNDVKDYEVLLITGIAVVHPLLAFLKEKSINFVNLHFGDHHNFSQKDIDHIRNAFSKMSSDNKLILTTEKDYVRLRPLLDEDLYYLPIQVKMNENEVFNNKILAYVKQKK